MIGVVMAGGKATRMGCEKCLLEFEGETLLDRVYRAVSRVCEPTYVAVSPNAPETWKYAAERYRVVETPGRGYVEDVRHLMSVMGSPFLTAACDLPYLREEHVARMVSEFQGHSLVAVVPVGGRLIPAGLNVVADDVDEYLVFHDPLLAVNVNTPEDYARVRKFGLTGER